MTFEVDLDETLNLFIGDNECGKSSLLTAIDLALSGSRHKVEAAGLENLFNSETIATFLASGRKYEELPVMQVELFLNDFEAEELNGKNNSFGKPANGLKLICAPNDELGKPIKEILAQESPNFPFEYYSISFKTFADQPYTGYRKFLKHILVDNALTSSEYAMKEYIKDIYHTSIESAIEKFTHQHKYRAHKETFKNDVLLTLNSRMGEYSFGIRSGIKDNLESDLTILEGNISIENKGKGKQVFVKTELALKKGEGDLEIILMEEPENHLSHTKTNLLVSKIRGAVNRQIFIATHSTLISTRLDLRKTILLNAGNCLPMLLKDLPESTAKFFMKAPDNNMLEFVLATKVILVEGDAEYMLMNAMYKKQTGNNLQDDGVHVISVDGTSFKRYLDIALIAEIKTAVIRDNDGDYQANCLENYKDYSKDHIAVFSDDNNANTTFEKCFYQVNTTICDELFKEGRRTLTVQEYMLKNKADAAFAVLEHKAEELIVPDYITKAIQWIKR